MMVSQDMYTLLAAQETVTTCNVGAWRCFAQTQSWNQSTHLQGQGLQHAEQQLMGTQR